MLPTAAARRIQRTNSNKLLQIFVRIYVSICGLCSESPTSRSIDHALDNCETPTQPQLLSVFNGAPGTAIQAQLLAMREALEL